MQWLKSNDTVFPVLKSNAYGHGIKQISQILRDTHVPYICVDSLPEYQIVKKYARKKSLIIGETLPSNYLSLDPRRATPCIYNIGTLKALIHSWKSWNIHIFLNTWMNREGIQQDDLLPFLHLLKHTKIRVEGVMSHFSHADEIDSSFCESQKETYKRMYQIIADELVDHDRHTLHYKHIGNSAGIAKIDDPFFTAWRAWLALYGYTPLNAQDPYAQAFAALYPVLQVNSTVVSLQHMLPWDKVSYSGRFTTDHAMTMATIPFGYNEWLRRRLLGNWSVKRKDMYLPVRGTICMNLCSIDTLDQNIRIWDVVEVISSDPHAKNSITRFAHLTDTIPYEVLVKLDSKCKRIIV